MPDTRHRRPSLTRCFRPPPEGKLEPRRELVLGWENRACCRIDVLSGFRRRQGVTVTWCTPAAKAGICSARQAVQPATRLATRRGGKAGINSRGCGGVRFRSIAKIGRILIGWNNAWYARTMPGCKPASQPGWPASDSRLSACQRTVYVRARQLRDVGFPGGCRLCCRAPLPGIMGTHFSSNNARLQLFRGGIQRSRRVSRIPRSTFLDTRAVWIEQRLGSCYARQLVFSAKQPPGGCCLAGDEPTVYSSLQ